MTLQELSEHYQLRAQLEKDEDILYNLRMAAIPSAHPLDGMPRAPGVSDKVGALAIAIVDMEERISYLKEQIAQQEGKISAWISTIENDQTRQIFRMRFIGCLTWAEVAQVIGGRNTENGVKMIRYESETSIVNNEKTYKVGNVWYVCPGCGCISDEYTMKRAPAKWVADNPAAYDNGIRSFWLNAFVSQWATWKSIVLKFLEAIGDTAKMQVVYNTCFGKLWENRGDIQDEDTLLGRREEYEAELPDGVLVLTAGIDTQDDRMEYEIKGHGHFNETWGIEKGIVMGRPDDDATWEQLDDLVFNRYFQFKDGIKLRVSMSFVDEGGHFTQEVRQRCRERIGRKVFCIKGFAGPDRPYTGPPKQVKIVVNGTHVGTCWQYQIGVDAGKQIIMDNLRVGTVGPKYCHFPKRDDYGIGYFNGLLSEHLVYKKDKRQPWQWEKIPGHERNEALDCCNYAMAAFKALPCDLDGIDRALKRARGVAVDAPAALEVPQTKSPQPKRRGLSKYYDEW